MRKRHWMGRVIVALLVGAGVTWGLAWSVPMFQLERGWRLRSTTLGWYTDPRGDRADVHVERMNFGSQRLEFLVGTQEDLDLMIEGLTHSDGPYCRVTEAEHQMGFPFPAMAMRATQLSSRVEGKSHENYLLTEYVDIQRKRPMVSVSSQSLPKVVGLGTYRFPTGILLLGFAKDTVLWGGIAWGLMWTWAGLVRARRRARGRCVVCQYDLTGNESGVCPECGEGI